MKSAAAGFEAQWIDVHAHFMVPQTEEELKRSAIARCERCFLVPELYQWTAEAALEHMDRNGIAMQLLSNIPKSLKALRESNARGFDRSSPPVALWSSARVADRRPGRMPCGDRPNGEAEGRRLRRDPPL
jgi:hypothetical protein